MKTIIKKVRSYITKNNNIPASIKVDENKYTYGQLNYLLLDYILNNNTKIKNNSISNAPAPTNEKLSTTLTKKEYLNILKTTYNFIKKNKRNPNYIIIKNKKISPLVMLDVLSRIADFQLENKRLPNTVKVDTNIIKKNTASPIQSNDSVFNYFVKVFGAVSTIDEALTKIKGRGYGHYFNDYLSNKQVIDNLKGSGKQKPNCVDVMQMLYHIGKALGYDVQIVHVKCRSSGEGHVFGKFRHSEHTGGSWIVRDGACVVSDNGKSVSCVWCGDGVVQAVNPSWFMVDVNR